MAQPGVKRRKNSATNWPEAACLTKEDVLLMVAQNLPLTPGTLPTAVRLNALNQRFRAGCWRPPTGMYSYTLCQDAAKGGHLAVLQWARANDYQCDACTCRGAAAGGHLTVLRWLRANGCPWDEQTCMYAAHQGHLVVLQWARGNGCPWDGATILFAEMHEHWSVVQWARDNGCPDPDRGRTIARLLQ